MYQNKNLQKYLYTPCLKNFLTKFFGKPPPTPLINSQILQIYDLNETEISIVIFDNKKTHQKIDEIHSQSVNFIMTLV